MELLPWLKYVFAVAVFLILVIAMVVLLCHKESTDTSEAYYRYQDRSDEDEVDGNIIGVSYKFKF